MKSETEPELRRTMCRTSEMGSPEGRRAAVALRIGKRRNGPRDHRRVHTSAMRSGDRARRKETDPAMKRRILERLGQMKTPEATDYFMEILGQP